jgi:hypothetical protein
MASEAVEASREVPHLIANDERGGDRQLQDWRTILRDFR